MYKRQDEKAYLLGGACGHAGLFSCVKDVSHFMEMVLNDGCLLYTSDAADDLLCVDIGGSRIIKKKN